MKKYNYDQSHDFEYRILGNDEFLKWARKSGFEPSAIESPMLFQMYSKFLEGKQAKAKATAKAQAAARATAKAKPKAKTVAPRKVIKPDEIKYTREVKTDKLSKQIYKPISRGQ